MWLQTHKKHMSTAKQIHARWCEPLWKWASARRKQTCNEQTFRGFRDCSGRSFSLTQTKGGAPAVGLKTLKRGSLRCFTVIEITWNCGRASDALCFVSKTAEIFYFSSPARMRNSNRRASPTDLNTILCVVNTTLFDAFHHQHLSHPFKLYKLYYRMPIFPVSGS